MLQQLSPKDKPQQVTLPASVRKELYRLHHLDGKAKEALRVELGKASQELFTKAGRARKIGSSILADRLSEMGACLLVAIHQVMRGILPPDCVPRQERRGQEFCAVPWAVPMAEEREVALRKVL